MIVHIKYADIIKILLYSDATIHTHTSHLSEYDMHKNYNIYILENVFKIWTNKLTILTETSALSVAFMFSGNHILQLISTSYSIK